MLWLKGLEAVVVGREKRAGDRLSLRVHGGSETNKVGVNAVLPGQKDGMGGRRRDIWGHMQDKSQVDEHQDPSLAGTAKT